MTKEGFSISKRLKSFSHVFSGLIYLIKEEHNARIHLFAATATITLGLYFGITREEWFTVGILIAFVFAMELVNSAIENLSDAVTKEQNEFIKKAKDQGAAAVFVSTFISLIIGLSIFVPYVLEALA